MRAQGPGPEIWYRVSGLPESNPRIESAFKPPPALLAVLYRLPRRGSALRFRLL